MINASFDIVTVQPASATVTHQLEGQHLVSLAIDNNEEVNIVLQSIYLRRIKDVVPWTAAAFFGAAISYLLGVFGLKTLVL
jgi:hypothetical protein